MNILTFDIEEWFHIGFPEKEKVDWDDREIRIYSNTDKILNALNEAGCKATFFCLGWIAEKYPEILRRISKSGHHIGCHSDRHELIFSMDINKFRQDTGSAIKKIEDVTGQKVDAYRAPGFSINRNSLWAFDVLSEFNIKYDCSVFPAYKGDCGFPEFQNPFPTLILANGYEFKEFPLNTVKILNYNVVFSGGGYFRLFPYFIIKKLMNHSDYIMAYFHPRDFDHLQPVLHHLPISRQLKSYLGLKNSFSKFKMLLKDFDFLTLKEADQIIDWNKACKINISC
jgi:peptidoglycan-N-acetylglucosamine deacetylase